MESSILKKLSSSGALFRFQGMLNIIDSRIMTTSIAIRLQELEQDDVMIAGRKLGDIATAILHITHFKTYTGNDEDILLMIEQFRIK